MTTKTVAVKTWTEETAAALATAYESGKTVAELATQFGKTEAAVRGKLVSMKVYQKQEVKAVGGASAVRKTHLVRTLAERLGLTFESVESLEKASKGALEALLKATEVEAE